VRDRFRTLRDRLGFADLATVGVLVLAFLIGGVVGGTRVTILSVCGGFGAECPNDEYIALNPATGLLAAALAIVVLLVLDRVTRHRRT
jgi:hypothetical protein